MTFEEIVKQFQKRITAATDKISETKTIILEINNLTYESNNQLISDQDKKRIFEALKQEIIYESVLIHAQDNKEYLDLIDQAIKMLKGN